VAFICGIAPDMPGLAKAINPNLNVPNGAVYLYSQSWTVAIVIAGVTYWACHKMSPMPITSAKNNDIIDGVEKESDAGIEVDRGDVRSVSEKPAVGKSFQV
jgi:nucleobase:cation symporter-1, NCS1 family